MADVTITELRAQALTQNGGEVLAVTMPPLAVHSVTVGASSAQSAAFGEFARFVRVVAPVTAFLEFGENPTATEADSIRLVADEPELFGVTPGHRLAVIQQA